MSRIGEQRSCEGWDCPSRAALRCELGVSDFASLEERDPVSVSSQPSSLRTSWWKGAGGGGERSSSHAPLALVV